MAWRLFTTYMNGGMKTYQSPWHTWSGNADPGRPSFPTTVALTDDRCSPRLFGSSSGRTEFSPSRAIARTKTELIRTLIRSFMAECKFGYGKGRWIAFMIPILHLAVRSLSLSTVLVRLFLNLWIPHASIVTRLALLGNSTIFTIDYDVEERQTSLILDSYPFQQKPKFIRG